MTTSTPAAQCVGFPGNTVGIPTFLPISGSGMVTLNVGFPTFPDLYGRRQTLHTSQHNLQAYLLVKPVGGATP